MTTSEESEREISELVDQCVARLMEHCDAVQIFVSVQDKDDKTSVYRGGRGNYFARLGMVKEWVRDQTEDEE